ncbi:hypothetical protein [Corynebacterium sp. CCM 9204]|uniref:hypothetical protein n=1 Tax=Corynebacterium sp. CCM 9204 TaxID=3057616 RepID=UPI0035242222
MHPILSTVSKTLIADGHSPTNGDGMITVETKAWVLTFTVSDKNSLIASGMWKKLTAMENSAPVIDLIQAWYTRGWDLPSAGYNTDIAPGHIVLVSSAALMCADRIDEGILSAFTLHTLHGTRRLMEYAARSLPDGEEAAVTAFDAIPQNDEAGASAPGISPSELHAVLSGLDDIAVGITHGSARRGPVIYTMKSADHSPWYKIEARWRTGLPGDDVDLLTMTLHICNEFTVSAAGPVMDFVTSQGEVVLKATALVFCPGRLDPEVLSETLDRKIRWMQTGLHHVSDRLRAPSVCPLP